MRGANPIWEFMPMKIDRIDTFTDEFLCFV